MKISRGHFTLRGALCAVAAVSLLTGLLVSTVPTARAVENLPGTTVVYPNTWYAYVGAGENLDVQFTKTRNTSAAQSAGVPITVEGPGGVAQSCTFAQTDPAGTVCDFADLTSPTAGIWRITLETSGGIEQIHYPGLFADAGAYLWDIDVQLGAVDVSGRVWSEKYTQAQATLFQDATSLYDISFWFQSEFGVLYEVDYTDYNGIHSIFLADPVGNRVNGSCTSAYKSVYFNDPDFSPADEGECNDGAFKLFFEQPDQTLPATATTWDGGSDWINPPVVAPDASNLAFVPNSPDIYSGTLTFGLVNFPGGNVDVQVDTDNDGSFVGPADRTIVVGGSDMAPVSMPFDGLDGLGQPIPPTRTIRFRVVIDDIAEIHFVNYDVETRGGIEVTQLTSDPALVTAAGDKTITWDDTHLDQNSDGALAPGGPSNSLTWAITTWPGCPGSDPKCASATFQGQDVNSAGGVHGWDWGPLQLPIGWGNNRYIDDWKSAQIQPVITPELTVDGRTGGFDVAKSSTPPEGTSVSPGDVVTYNVTVTNTSQGQVPITVTGITVDDDLTDVLDDATLTGTPTATAGSVSVVGDQLTWTGDVSPGVPVTITYQVTVNGETELGDFVLENLVSSAGSASCPPGDPGPVCSTVHPIAIVSPDPLVPGDDGGADDTVVGGETEERSGTLPFTGRDFALMAALAMAIIGAGMFLAAMSRLRRRQIF